MIKRCLTSLFATLIVCFLACSSASARVCFLPDSADCGEGEGKGGIVGSGNVDVPCQYSSCPAYNPKYQRCDTERIYNNGGVNVECKQVKCILSKSACEEQEDNPNSSQCCNFDSASGCYYMGDCPVLCNRNIYDSTTALPEEDYNCTSCKDKNGTFYNCTAKEKECKDINPKYTSSCSDSQTAEEVEGVKDSNNNQCYTCKDKPVGCTYEYRQATTADSCGLRDFENTTKCMYYTINGCQCYPQLIKVSSVTAGAGTVVPYNKISNKSATCVDSNGVTRYQTICKGTSKSICSDYGNNYEFKPNGCVSDTYNNGFEVKGDEWGDCVPKEEKCFYEYRQATSSDSYGVTGNLDDGYKCTKGSQCHNNLKEVTSLDIRGGTPSVNPINKISNKSATCVDKKGVTRYQTICQGTTKSDCFSFHKDKKFTPNGCVSDPYNNGFEVKGDEWGTCGGCDTDKGAYDTIEECRSGTKSGCMSSGGCYKTCASQGYFSTEANCKNINYRVTCSKIGDCYNREMPGFAIRYASFPNRTWSCSVPNHGQTLQTFRAWLANVNIDSSGRHSVGYYAKSIDGIELSELSDKNQYYEPGTYFVCASRGSGVVGISRTVVQYARDMDGGDPTTQVCFADTISSQYSNQHCEKTQESGSGYSCEEVTFQKNKLYLISMYSNYGYPGWGYNQGTCSNN